MKPTHDTPSAGHSPGAGLPALAAAVVIAALAGAALAEVAAPAPQKPFPIAVVGALNALSGGPHAGYRAHRAKGVLVKGEFVSAPTAAASSKAVHFAARVPALPDADPNASPGAYAVSHGQRAL